jgi:protein-tyrosine phosphatase
MPDEADRRLSCPPCLNIRDVGGYRTTDGATIRRRTLLRGDNLCLLTPESCAVLLDAGLRTVVDLRHAHEVETAAHPFGAIGPHAGAVTYRHLPLRHPDNTVLAAAVEAATSQGEIYRLTLDHGAEQIAAVMRAIADAPDGAVIVHCNVGKDRTGVVVALLLALAGVPNETIVADYAVSAGYLQPLYQSRLAAGRQENRDDWQSEPATMRAFLTHLDTVHGGARRFLVAAGVTPDQIERLRARLRDEASISEMHP